MSSAVVVWLEYACNYFIWAIRPALESLSCAQAGMGQRDQQTSGGTKQTSSRKPLQALKDSSAPGLIKDAQRQLLLPAVALPRASLATLAEDGY